MSLTAHQTQEFVKYLRESIEYNKTMMKYYRNAPKQGYTDLLYMETFCENRMVTFQDVLTKVQSLIEVPQEEE
jgi:hypothetical protein